MQNINIYNYFKSFGGQLYISINKLTNMIIYKKISRFANTLKKLEIGYSFFPPEIRKAIKSFFSS